LREKEHKNEESCASDDDELGLENEYNNLYNQGPDHVNDGLDVNICDDSIEQSTGKADANKASLT
jgi:hypothetical protein